MEKGKNLEINFDDIKLNSMKSKCEDDEEFKIKIGGNKSIGAFLKEENEESKIEFNLNLI